jgi:uncharacterized protein YijF (DUF1287 family)
MSRKRIVVGIILGLILVMGCCLYRFRFYFIGTSSEEIDAKDNSDFNIADIVSFVDKDQDGIDDQTDILEGARKYIDTKPVYKSKYYDTGYSNDKYGVCTDVVANAMLNAGYDLRQLVNDDIMLHPDDYDIDEPDVNIDFRRVRNLKVYFKHTAISLTTDINKIEEWQGGDIVIFENHIGIVSDKRNDNGVSFVIHHNDPFQAAYEEDILERRDDIVGHYRISE